MQNIAISSIYKSVTPIFCGRFAEIIPFISEPKIEKIKRKNKQLLKIKLTKLNLTWS